MKIKEKTKIQAKDKNYSKVYEFPALVFPLTGKARAPWAGEEATGRADSQTLAHKNLVPGNPARHLFPISGQSGHG